MPKSPIEIYNIEEKKTKKVQFDPTPFTEDDFHMLVDGNIDNDKDQ